MKLSICIATVPDRADMFATLTTFIKNQPGFHDNCEIVSNASERGTISIGHKRNLLNQQAKGEYVVHIDDDDFVPDFYVSAMLQALEKNPDCVGHYELVEGLNKVPQIGIWTNESPKWMDGNEAMRRWSVSYVRTPFHKTAMRREIALQVPFNDLTFGEDHEFSIRLKQSGLIKTEVFIPKVMQFYRYKFEPHEKKFPKVK